MKATTIEALAKVLTYAQSHDTFYAADIGLSGAQVSALKSLGRTEDYIHPDVPIIEPTGNIREVWFNVGEGTRKRGEVCEWKLSTETRSWSEFDSEGYRLKYNDPEIWRTALLGKISRMRKDAEAMAEACRAVEALLSE